MNRDKNGPKSFNPSQKSRCTRNSSFSGVRAIDKEGTQSPEMEQQTSGTSNTNKKHP